MLNENAIWEVAGVASALREVVGEDGDLEAWTWLALLDVSGERSDGVAEGVLEEMS